MKRKLIVLLAVVLTMSLLLVACQPANESEQPEEEASKPVFKDGDVITVIVAFSAGGGYDKIARLIQPYLEENIRKITGSKVSVIVENIVGGSGVVGYKKLALAEPDGKTIGVMGTSGEPYNALRSGEYVMHEYTPIVQLNSDHTVFVVASDSDISSWDQLVDRSQQDSILIATPGQGTSTHVVTLILQDFLKTKEIEMQFDYVHYDGPGPAMLGVVKGEADAMTIDESTAAQLVTSGELKGILMFSMDRGNLIKEAPTLKEENIPGAEELVNIIGMNRFLVAPPELPENIAEVLREATKMSLHDQDFINKAGLAQIGIDYQDENYVREIIRVREEIASKYIDFVK